MLGKLFKYEMRSMARLFLPMMIGFAAVSLLCKFTFESSYSFFSDSSLSDIIMVIFFLLYFMYVAALFVMTSVFIAMHFYKTMAGDQGYLTNTLPVKTATLIHAKLLSAVIWEIISSALLFLSFSLFFMGHLGMEELRELAGSMGQVFHELSLYMNMPLLTAEMVILTVLELISGPLMLYVSIALGQLFRKHRVLWAVVFFFVIYIGLQMIAGIVYNALGRSIPLSGTARAMQQYAMFTTVFSALCTAGFYAVTRYIFTKRLNLD